MLTSLTTDNSGKAKPNIFIGLAIGFAAFIFLIIMLANQNSNMWLFRLQGSIPYFDKFGHFFLIGGMTFLGNLALRMRTVSLRGRQVLLASLIVLVVFTLEEFMQLGLTHRTFDLGDLTADYLGIAVFGRIATTLSSRLKA